MKQEKKYIVYEIYGFGKNYYNDKLECVPDYQITDKIPMVNKIIVNILLERNPYLIVETVKD